MTEPQGARQELREFANRFTDLTSSLTDEHTAQVDSDTLVDVAARALPHAEHCGLTLLRDIHPPISVSATGPLPAIVDGLQYDVAEGPCIEAFGQDDLVLVDDFERPQRWPRFAARAVVETEVRSVLWVRLRLRGEDRAAMSFHAGRAGAFDGLDVGLASMFASYAKLAVQSRVRQHDVDSLRAALVSTRQIATSVGVLMARESVTREQAFAMLRVASQHLNRTLRDIAAEVETTGHLPEAPAP